ncbi:hypothetical protein [uncultured Dialister sp.]|uniref:hypothetical protein n=1 Tax=uncultured Dialister sp. TaxID=278064 RepID=UPI0025DA4C3B|nr:hypothetical protein [uncultured Dialister sp.]
MGNMLMRGKTEFGRRIWDFGKMAALMHRKFLWGMYTDEFEKPVQAKKSPAPWPESGEQETLQVQIENEMRKWFSVERRLPGE